MANPDVLFRGIPRGRTRGYTAAVLRATKPSRVVIPCTGSFSLAAVSVAAGIAPTQIVCGDISLYSTALGHAIMGRDWRLELKPDAQGDELALVAPLLDGSPVDKAVAVLYATRVQQYRQMRATAHQAYHLAELLAHAPVYQQQIRAGVARLASSLAGLTYHARDMWLTLADSSGDAATALLVNPPRYTGGYDRMFKGVDALFDWDPPAATQFTEDDYARLMEQLGAEPALTLLYYATSTPDQDPAALWGPPWVSVFADKPGSSKTAAINWIVANRHVIAPVMSRSALVDGEAAFPLFEGELALSMPLTLKKVSPVIGQYYRDLFVHRLSTGATERYIALLLNGRLLSIIGIHLAAYYGRQRRTKVAERLPGITFAFTVPHASYDRLGKLTLLSLTSRELWMRLGEPHMELMGLPDRIETRMLTRHPENKTARGILKLKSREAQGDGTFKLVYEGPVIDRTLEDAKQLWLTKFSKTSKRSTRS